MSDFDALRARVDEAAETLSSAEAERHRQSDTLTQLLGELECRFEAQQQELHHYKMRAAPLEAMNQELAGLVDRLLVMIEQGFGEASVTPLRDAAAHAERILHEEMGVSAPVVVQADSPAEEPVDDAAEAPVDAASGTSAEEPGRFEDVGIAELTAESQIEAEDDAALPPVVVQAEREAAAAAADPIAQAIEAIDAEGSGQENASAPVESVDALAEQLAAEVAGADSAASLDIRALLERVESAVEDVRARVGPEHTDESDAGDQSAVA